MSAVFVAILLVTALLNIGFGITDYLQTEFVLANSAEVDVPKSWLPALGTIKLVGGIGVLAGLLTRHSIGTAAAIGLVLFFIGAVSRHLQTRVLHNIAFPGAFLLLAGVSVLAFSAL